MPEYHALRATLAAAELSLVILIATRRLGAFLTFLVYLWLHATFNLIPMQSQNPRWWRILWLPLALLCLSLAASTSLSLFRFTIHLTTRQERVTLLGLAVAAGVWFLPYSWYWNPANWFQSVITVRQYLTLILAVSTSVGWVWVRVTRPVTLPDGRWRVHGWLWCMWLWVGLVSSSTGAGGLARLVGDWTRVQMWRWVNDVLVTTQLILILVWIWNFSRRRQPDALDHVTGVPESALSFQRQPSVLRSGNH